jgi:formylglycine-generating enzyme required for sulfatase activity
MNQINKTILSGLLLCLNGLKKVGAIVNRKAAGWLTTVAILMASVLVVEATDPVVSKVQAAQRSGTHMVDIRYDVADADGDALWIKVEVSDDGGTSYALPAASFSGDKGFGIRPGSGKHIVWDAGVDWGGKYSANMRFRVTADDTLPQKMVWIAPGTFTRVGNKVTISRGFGMSKYEVTQAQYKAVMGTRTNPSWFKGDNNPVESVSWNDAVAYCAKLTGKEKAAGRLPVGYEYRLPTEAEWEYACRAGTTTAFSFGDDESKLGEYGWYGQYMLGEYLYSGNSGQTTHPVGQKKPNGWGLYDVHGNVYEWCQDWYGNYPGGSVTDPQGPATGSYRVRRGGGWITNRRDSRSEDRRTGKRGSRNSYGGFRPVLASTTNP